MTKRILLASAHQHHLDLYESVLGDLGYEILKATAASEAIQTSVHNLPSLIICIEGLSDIDLKSFCKILQANTVLGSIPLMIVSPTIDLSQLRKMAIDTSRTKIFANLEKDRIKTQTVQFVNEASKIIAAQAKIQLNQFDTYKATKSIQRFERHAIIKKYKKKESIFKEGSSASHLYYVRSGQVMTSNMNSTGKVFIHNIFCMGDFFGSLPLITKRINIRDTIATTDCEIYMVPIDIFLEEFNTNIEFTKAFSVWLGSFLIEVEDQMITMAFSPVRKRLARVLIRLFEKTPSERIKISREDLARISGTVKETAIRTLSDFKQERLIDIRKSDIIILDALKLKNIPD